MRRAELRTPKGFFPIPDYSKGAKPDDFYVNEAGYIKQRNWEENRDNREVPAESWIAYTDIIQVEQVRNALKMLDEKTAIVHEVCVESL